MSNDIHSVLSKLPYLFKDESLNAFLVDMEEAYSLFVTDYIFSTTNDTYEVFTGAFLKKIELHIEPIVSKYRNKNMVKAFFIYKFFEELDGRAEHGYRVLSPITISEIRNIKNYSKNHLFLRFGVKIKDKDSSTFTALLFILASINKDFKLTLLEFKQVVSTGNAFIQNSGKFGESSRYSNEVKHTSECSLMFEKFYRFIIESNWLREEDLAVIAFMKVHVLSDTIDAIYTTTGVQYNHIGTRLGALKTMGIQSSSDTRVTIPLVFSHVYPVGNYISRPNISLLALLFSNTMTFLERILIKDYCPKFIKDVVNLTIEKTYERFVECVGNPKNNMIQLNAFFKENYAIRLNGYSRVEFKDIHSLNVFKSNDIFENLLINDVNSTVSVDSLGVPLSVSGSLPVNYITRELTKTAATGKLESDFEIVFNAIQTSFDTIMAYADVDSKCLRDFSDLLFEFEFKDAFEKSKQNTSSDTSIILDKEFNELKQKYTFVPNFVLTLVKTPFSNSHNSIPCNVLELIKNIGKEKLINDELISLAPSITNGDSLQFLNNIMAIERQSITELLASNIINAKTECSLISRYHNATGSNGIIPVFNNAVLAYLVYHILMMEDVKTSKFIIHLLGEFNRLLSRDSSKPLILWYVYYSLATMNDDSLPSEVKLIISDIMNNLIFNMDAVQHINAMYSKVHGSSNAYVSVADYATTNSPVINKDTFDDIYGTLFTLVNSNNQQQQMQGTVLLYPQLHKTNVADLVITEELNYNTDLVADEPKLIHQFTQLVNNFIKIYESSEIHSLMEDFVVPMIAKSLSVKDSSAKVNEGISINDVIAHTCTFDKYFKDEVYRRRITSELVVNPALAYHDSFKETTSIFKEVVTAVYNDSLSNLISKV